MGLVPSGLTSCTGRSTCDPWKATIERSDKEKLLFGRLANDLQDTLSKPSVSGFANPFLAFFRRREGTWPELNVKVLRVRP